ncbi:amidohydrolase family protein [Flagellimonas marina]|uniref:Amidohydrolase family protein n=2 Tax=Flagellimonas marina TaxID=1775168 RepID=A0ABV8PQ53_9FLAO
MKNKLRFSDLEKIDAHMHYNTYDASLLEQAELDNFSLISINTDAPFFDPIEDQEKKVLNLNSNRAIHITTFTMTDWGRPNWLDTAIDQIKSGIKNGAIAVKFWKNIGMDSRDGNGNFIMFDHPCFEPIFDFLIENNIPILAHLGEPKNCWLPLDEMTMNSDQEYFRSHPEYHMANLPDYPSYEQQLAARDNVLRKHRDLRFIGAHFSSMEWSIEKIGAWLDEFPNTAVDMAERICHIQFQAKDNWSGVRDFLMKYQDRILYGTDIIYDKTNDPSEIKNRAHWIWFQDWKFFTTNNTMEAPQFKGQFKGIELPDKVIKKIYRENALTWYPSLQKHPIANV